MLALAAVAAIVTAPWRSAHPCYVTFPRSESAAPKSEQKQGSSPVAQEGKHVIERREFLNGVVAPGLVAATGSRAVAVDEIIATFKVDLEGDADTSEELQVRLRPDWAPRGVQRFMDLVEIGDLNEAAVYRVDKDIGVAVFGLPAEPTALTPPSFRDDRVRASNKRGTLSFVHGGPGTRQNEMFFNTNDNSHLDRKNYAPIGEVVEGDMEVVDKFFSGYAKAPDRLEIMKKGNNYLDDKFPKLSKIKSVTIDTV